MAPARRARDQPVPQAVGPAGGPVGFGGTRRTLLARFDVVFAVSERDRATLAALVPTGPRIALLPNVADPALLERPELTPSPEPVLLFLATLSWPPNAEGLSRFLDDDFPALLERVPGRPPRRRRLRARPSGSSGRST